MRGRLLLLVCGVCAVVAGCAPPSEAPRAAGRDILLERDSEIIEATVPRNATLSGLLRAHQISEDLANDVVHAARAVFDPRRLRAQQPYRIERGLDGALREFVYRIDADRFLRVVGFGDDEDRRYDVEVVAYEKQRALVSLRGEISRQHNSIVAAVSARGENVTLAMALADVFGGDIDFNNDLQPGDSFEIVFEKALSEGEFAGYGPILAAEFRNDGRVLRAFRYEAPGREPGYFDEQGRSRKRFFLRSPLKFEPRISSGFSYRRLHPVHGTWRSHPAIDYVAPVGAPVIAVASGTVVRAGYFGAAGNMVTLQHANGYESSYLHLSAISRGVRPGARVSQGEMIGRVGATGVVTGPHLDYRLKKNGAWVNPLVEHKKLPPGEPIAPEHRAAFDAQLARTLPLFVGPPAETRLASLEPPAGSAVAGE
jgi:murein DD-endopeptidase MepM/ murein hydrolase activator NlpD